MNRPILFPGKIRAVIKFKKNNHKNTKSNKILLKGLIHSVSVRIRSSRFLLRFWQVGQFSYECANFFWWFCYIVYVYSFVIIFHLFEHKYKSIEFFEIIWKLSCNIFLLFIWLPEIFHWNCVRFENIVLKTNNQFEKIVIETYS